MRPTSFEDTGDLRVLCKLRLKPIHRLMHQAKVQDDMKAYRHYYDLSQKEINEFTNGQGVYI